MAKTSNETPSTPLKITAIPIADAARVLSSASGRDVTEAQVREVAERGELVRADGTISLLEYAAFLVRELAHGADTDN